MLDFSVGLSGCKLELIDSRVLRKYSSSTSYNLRLSLQVNKQVLFSRRILKNVDTPKVYNIRDEYFDMEYIPGKSFVEFFSTSSIKDIEFVIDTLFEYFINVQSNINEKIVPKTFCHGDLTFNNIIFHKNRLFFIDFLRFLC
jgi:tRNA A-37 threonylcarbamoyl transferase component Bud32